MLGLFFSLDLSGRLPFNRLDNTIKPPEEGRAIPRIERRRPAPRLSHLQNPSREKESGQTQDGFGHFLIMPLGKQNLIP
jgi:hypothetical protein